MKRIILTPKFPLNESEVSNFDLSDMKKKVSREEKIQKIKDRLNGNKEINVNWYNNIKMYLTQKFKGVSFKVTPKEISMSESLHDLVGEEKAEDYFDFEVVNIEPKEVMYVLDDENSEIVNNKLKMNDYLLPHDIVTKICDAMPENENRVIKIVKFIE